MNTNDAEHLERLNVANSLENVKKKILKIV